MDIQPVFNKYKAVTYMCQYFSQIEHQCSQSTKQEAKEVILMTPLKEMLKLT